MITFTLPIAPIAKGRPRIGRNGSVYTPQKTRGFEKTVRLMSNPYKPVKPLLGAIKLEVTFMMKAPVKRKHCYPIVRPDLDNLLKAIKDSFNGMFWNDDAQVVQLVAEKIYSYVDNKPSIQVRIQELEV